MRQKVKFRRSRRFLPVSSMLSQGPPEHRAAVEAGATTDAAIKSFCLLNIETLV